MNNDEQKNACKKRKMKKLIRNSNLYYFDQLLDKVLDVLKSKYKNNDIKIKLITEYLNDFGVLNDQSIPRINIKKSTIKILWKLLKVITYFAHLEIDYYSFDVVYSNWMNTNFSLFIHQFLFPITNEHKEINYTHIFNIRHKYPLLTKPAFILDHYPEWSKESLKSLKGHLYGELFYGAELYRKQLNDDKNLDSKIDDFQKDVMDENITISSYLFKFGINKSYTYKITISNQFGDVIRQSSLGSQLQYVLKNIPIPYLLYIRPSSACYLLSTIPVRRNMTPALVWEEKRLKTCIVKDNEDNQIDCKETEITKLEGTVFEGLSFNEGDIIQLTEEMRMFIKSKKGHDLKSQNAIDKNNTIFLIDSDNNIEDIRIYSKRPSTAFPLLKLVMLDHFKNKGLFDFNNYKKEYNKTEEITYKVKGIKDICVYLTNKFKLSFFFDHKQKGPAAPIYSYSLPINLVIIEEN